MHIDWQPLGTWPANRKPTPGNDRATGSTFQAGWPKTLDELEYELGRITARDVVIEIDIDPRELRRNGEPLARANVRKTPGVVLHYKDKDGRAVTMPCDRYRSWQANVRALMLTLRALRAVDRYGATANAEQYRGWTALPAITTPTMTTEKAAFHVVRYAGGKFSESRVLADAGECRKALQHAMATTHPDKPLNGGDRRDFQLVGECKRILQAHHGVDL